MTAAASSAAWMVETAVDCAAGMSISVKVSFVDQVDGRHTVKSLNEEVSVLRDF
jgi:hypothetical protein